MFFILGVDCYFKGKNRKDFLVKIFKEEIIFKLFIKLNIKG